MYLFWVKISNDKFHFQRHQQMQFKSGYELILIY